MVDQCWANVVDGGPTLVKHWVDVLCLLGYPANEINTEKKYSPCGQWAETLFFNQGPINSVGRQFYVTMTEHD